MMSKDKPYLPYSEDKIEKARVVEDKSTGLYEFPSLLDAEKAFYRSARWKHENRKITFFCPVRDSETGEGCPAQLSLYEKNGKHFFKTNIGSNHYHVFAGNEKILNPEIRYNPDTFLYYLLYERKRTAKKIINVKLYSNPYSVTIDNPLPTEPDNLEDYYRQTRFCDLFSEVPDYPDGRPGKQKYHECLVNKNTIESFRTGQNGLGLTALAITEIPSEPDETIESLKQLYSEVSTGPIVLRDPFSIYKEGIEEDRLYFVLDYDSNNRISITRGKKYLVLCEWNKSESIDIGVGHYKSVRIVRGFINKPSAQIKQLPDKIYNRYEK